MSISDTPPTSNGHGLYLGTAEQLTEWAEWPGRASQPEGDLLDLDARDHPPRPYSTYPWVVVWYTADTAAQAGWARENLPSGPDTRLARFPVEEARAVEAARVETAEATATAPDRRIAHVAQERYEWHKADDLGKKRYQAEQLAETVGERVKMTAREFAKLPKPPVVMEQILAAEVNILAGPEASGKSLWVRDLALCVAAQKPWRGHWVPAQRDVLLIFSEGTHDFSERYETHPLWHEAADHVWVLDVPVDLVHGEDTDWLLKEYADERPGLVVFDVIYGMGMGDDTGTKDVFPVLGAMKKISAEWDAATLAIGHPPHSHTTGTRRMRGSSAWRNLAYTDWYMGEGRLTCEKSKITHAASKVFPYRAAYPDLAWLTTGDFLAEASMRLAVIEASVAADPSMTIRARAEDLAEDMGVGVEMARKLISSFIKDRKDSS